MGRGHAERVEKLMDTGAAMLFAGALGYAVLQFAAVETFAAAASAVSFLGCFHALRRVEPQELAFALGAVDYPDIPQFEADELVLTDADRLHAPAPGTDELLLHRALTHVGRESRVVRLFEPAAMPTVGELQARIDRHLGESPQIAPPDASQALYDALAELRRSLR